MAALASSQHRHSTPRRRQDVSVEDHLQTAMKSSPQNVFSSIFANEEVSLLEDLEELFQSNVYDLRLLTAVQVRYSTSFGSAPSSTVSFFSHS